MLKFDLVKLFFCFVLDVVCYYLYVVVEQLDEQCNGIEIVVYQVCKYFKCVCVLIWLVEYCDFKYMKLICRVLLEVVRGLSEVCDVIVLVECVEGFVSYFEGCNVGDMVIFFKDVVEWWCDLLVLEVFLLSCFIYFVIVVCCQVVYDLVKVLFGYYDEVVEMFVEGCSCNYCKVWVMLEVCYYGGYFEVFYDLCKCVQVIVFQVVFFVEVWFFVMVVEVVEVKLFIDILGYEYDLEVFNIFLYFELYFFGVIVDCDCLVELIMEWWVVFWYDVMMIVVCLYFDGVKWEVKCFVVFWEFVVVKK